MVRIENNKLIIEVVGDAGLFSPVETLETWKEALIRIVQRYDNKDYTDNPVYWIMEMLEAFSPDLDQVKRGLSTDGDCFDLPENMNDNQRSAIAEALYGLKHGNLPSAGRNPIFDYLKNLNS